MLKTIFLTIILGVSGLVNASNANIKTTQQKICLNGVWEFRAAETSVSSIPSDGWGELRVPSSISSYGIHNFGIENLQTSCSSGWYRRSFFVPKSWADGRRIKLYFLAVDWSHKIYVNGEMVDASDTMRLCFEVDITKKVKFGQENSLAVWVARQNPDDRDYGILRSVYLTVVPALHVRYSHVITSVQKKTITVRTTLINDSEEKKSTVVRFAVCDNGREVLTLPEKTVTLPAKESVVVETSAPWSDPVLWGFGKYGKPHLYHLRTSLHADSDIDVRFDRFGFREFRSLGKTLLFNEKPYSIKGDLITRGWPFVENPNFLVAYYEGMRSANITFQRLHGCSTLNFDSHYWYQVADELGHLVEAQLQPINPQKPDDPAHLALWTAYVNENFNHPSLVLWCPDNEHFSAPMPMENCAIKITPEVVPSWNRLATHIRQLDPTRILDFNHGFALFAGVQMGFFDKDNYMTFNIHPYGTLSEQVARAKRALEFDDSVPVIVGEVFDFAKEVNMIADPVGSFLEQQRRGRVFAANIDDLAKQGLYNVILCSLQRSGFIGYNSTSVKDFYAGPWSDYIILKDTNGEKIVGQRESMVKVRWPSLSGEGNKVVYLSPQMSTIGADGGYGHNFNWFDPTRPMFYTNITHRLVRDAYVRMDGITEPSLGPERTNEVIVCFGINRKPIEGACVYLIPEEGQSPPTSAVVTDKDGTAWFHFWDTGKYRAVAEYQGKTFSKVFVIPRRPKLTEKAGYDHIVWIDLGGIDSVQRRRDISRAAEFTDGLIRRPGEILFNGDMEFWKGNVLQYWPGGNPILEKNIKKSGKYSTKLTGSSSSITRPCSLTKGVRYLISGWAYKEAGNGSGTLQIKTGRYDILVALAVGRTVGQWEYVEKEYTAQGTESYFYCQNPPESKAVFYFDDISIKEISSRGEDSTLRSGAFPVNDVGYITDWLVLGPMPNKTTETLKGTVQIGHRTDWLKEFGGETGVRPRFGDRVKVLFPPDGDWLEGTDWVAWRNLHSAEAMVSLAELKLPSRGITLGIPTNVCGYVACIVVSPTSREAILAIGSDDGNKVWWNGVQIGDIETSRGIDSDQEKYPVSLKQGKNRLLIKVTQGSQDWKVCARFLDKEGKPLTNLKVQLEE